MRLIDAQIVQQILKTAGDRLERDNAGAMRVPRRNERVQTLIGADIYKAEFGVQTVKII